MEWSVYDLQDEFTIEEAAYLWCSLEPRNGYGIQHPPAVASLIKTLRSAIERGELRARESGGWDTLHCYSERSDRARGIPMYSPTGHHVSRRALKQWAQSKERHPPFLFPDERKSVSDLKDTAIAGLAGVAAAGRNGVSAAAEKAGDALTTRPEVLPPEPAAPALPAPGANGRTRQIRIRTAIETADAALRAKLGRLPTAREVFDHLVEDDETGCVVDSKADVLIWEDGTGKLHDQHFRVMSNLLSKIRKGR